MAVVERDFGANFIVVEVLGNKKVNQNMYVIWLDQEGSATVSRIRVNISLES